MMNLAEQRLHDRILSAQKFLWRSLGVMGVERDKTADPEHSGFIGVRQSVITTKTGSLSAKQCSTNPLWGVQFMRWFGELGVRAGDRVVVSASSSFPAMVYACLAACETLGLRVIFMLSLGSSSWGANREGMNFAGMLDVLRRGAFLKTRPSLYTLGGVNENADGMDDAAKTLLQGNVSDDELVKGLTLDELVTLISGSRVLINIGGNASSMGMDRMTLPLPPGVVYPAENIDGGNGLVNNALKAGVPVINVREVRMLAKKCGID